MSAEDDRLYLQNAAEQGDAQAQYLLGLWYFSGQGGQKDYAKAAEWYGKAAEQGDAMSQYYMGLLYLAGQGVPEDKTNATELFSKAAIQGVARAQYYTGLLSQDYAKAAEWYEKAAEQGDDDAQYELGILYAKGQGVPQNIEKADVLFRNAAAQGNEKAKDFLAKVRAENDRK